MKKGNCSLSHFCCVLYTVLGGSFYLCLVRGHLVVIPAGNRKLYRCFGVHKKHQVVLPLEVDKYEEKLMSVASYIKHSVDEVREVTENQKKSLNGPDGTVASKTVDYVQMITDGVLQLDGNLQAVNGEYKVNLESCMTEQVESLHATHHHKHDAGAHVLDYARSFGKTV